MCSSRALTTGVLYGLRGFEMRASPPPVESNSGTPPVQTQHPSPSSSPFDHPSPSESDLQVDVVHIPPPPTTVFPGWFVPPPWQFVCPHA